MSDLTEDPFAAPFLDGGGGAESRIFHWLDHALATLWFVSQPGEWARADWPWRQLQLIAGTLQFLGAEHHDARAGYAASSLLDLLDLLSAEGPEVARQRAPKVAADISARRMHGNWPEG